MIGKGCEGGRLKAVLSTKRCRQHGVAHPLIGISLKWAGRMVCRRIEREDLWNVFPVTNAFPGDSAAGAQAVTRAGLFDIASVALALARAHKAVWLHCPPGSVNLHSMTSAALPADGEGIDLRRPWFSQKPSTIRPLECYRPWTARCHANC